VIKSKFKFQKETEFLLRTAFAIHSYVLIVASCTGAHRELEFHRFSGNNKLTGWVVLDYHLSRSSLWKFKPNNTNIASKNCKLLCDKEQKLPLPRISLFPTCNLFAFRPLLSIIHDDRINRKRMKWKKIFARWALIRQLIWSSSGLPKRKHARHVELLRSYRPQLMRSLVPLRQFEIVHHVGDAYRIGSARNKIAGHIADVNIREGRIVSRNYELMRVSFVMKRWKGTRMPETKLSR